MKIMKEERSLRRSWEYFVQKGVLDPGVDTLVGDSWKRSSAFGVNPKRTVGARCLSTTDLEACTRQRADFIAIAMPLMHHLYELLQGSGFMVTLCNESGILLRVIGDSQTLQDAERIQFVEGADWSEPVMGTNAIGTCISLNRPLQIYAAEHYTLACQSWTCSASPVHNPDGEIVGVLNMSGPFEKVHAHTLGMVVSAVKAIENQLSLGEKNRKNEMMQRYLEATVNALTDGVAILDAFGRVLKVNELFLQLLGLKENQIMDVTLDQLVDDLGQGNRWTGQGSFIHRELNLSVRKTGKTMHVLATSQPIFGSQGEEMGSLVILKQMKQVRQFVNQMINSQAKVTFADILGDSREFMDCVREAKLAAKTDASIVLTGESGTGKDLFAQAIHCESKRRNRPFIAINCGAIPRDLLGSELFGYVDGAFTGARKGGSAGKFELADGGTLFLDEVGEMSLEMQVLLLRVLQNREVVRIGGHEVIPVDVRIVAATNQDLRSEVLRGHFRADLYYRLNVMPIQILSLRQRRQDIPLLVEHFTKQFSMRLGRNVRAVSPMAMQFLTHAEWPGNVRELQNVLERAVLKTTGPELLVEGLPADLRGVNAIAPLDAAYTPLREEIKKDALVRSIQYCRGNLKEAAKYLGISRSTLYRQMDKFGLR